MADSTAPQGVAALPQDGNTGRLWAGRVRRAITTNHGFPASTTTPFSGNAPAGIIIWDAALAYSAGGSATPYGEFDLSDITGFEVIVSNAGSTQTLSGFTLQDYDTLPSGLTIPGASYASATNVATGAAVTLSALNLANNGVVRLWIPVTTAQLRKLVLNATYGAAVTQGTGSLEVRVTPTFGTLSLSGSSGLYGPQTVLLAYTAYTVASGAGSWQQTISLPAGTVYVPRRILLRIYNNTDEATTSTAMGPGNLGGSYGSYNDYLAGIVVGGTSLQSQLAVTAGQTGRFVLQPPWGPPGTQDNNTSQTAFTIIQNFAANLGAQGTVGLEAFILP